MVMKMVISKIFCLSLSLLLLLFSTEVSATYTWQMYQRVEDYATGDIRPYKFYNNCWWFKVPANGNTKPYFRLASTSSSGGGNGGNGGGNGNGKGVTSSQTNPSTNRGGGDAANTKAQNSRNGTPQIVYIFKGQLPSIPTGAQNRPSKGGDSRSQQPSSNKGGSPSGKGGEAPSARTKGGEAENPSYKGESVTQSPRGKGDTRNPSGKGENMPPRKGETNNYSPYPSRREGQKGGENRGQNPNPNPNKYNDEMSQYDSVDEEPMDDRSNRNTRSIDEEYVTSRPINELLYDVSPYMMKKRR